MKENVPPGAVLYHAVGTVKGGPRDHHGSRDTWEESSWLLPAWHGVPGVYTGVYPSAMDYPVRHESLDDLIINGFDHRLWHKVHQLEGSVRLRISQVQIVSARFT